MDEPIETDARALSIGDYVAILKRRIWLILVPIVVISAGAAVYARLLPPVFRSEATIMVEAPDVPPEIVASTVSEDAAQRIQAINQRVMSTQKLSEIVTKHDLYAEERRRKSIDSVVATMRKDISMRLISAGGKGTTIAFTVAFEHGESGIAQRVTNDLVSLYLSENLRTRQRKAAETTAFLGGEADRLTKLIVDLETKLAGLKQRYAGSLPEQLEDNFRNLARAEAELRALDQRRQMVEDRKAYLETEQAQLSPYAFVTINGEQVSSPKAHLAALRTQLITASAKYSPEHPEVVYLKRQIDAFAKEIDQTQGVADLRAARDRIQTELDGALTRYTEEHPDVVALKRKLQDAEAALAKAGVDEAAASGPKPDNPAYVQLEAQIEGARFELKDIARQRQAVEEAIAAIETRIEQTSLVEGEYREVQRSLEFAKTQYQNIKGKQVTANLGEALETEQKGERFTLIEPASRPGEPVKPNRPMIVTLGVVLSAGAGVGLAVLAEMVDAAVRGGRGVAALTGAPPLAVIPYIRTRREIRRRRRLRVAAAALVLAAIAAGVGYVHFKVMPLDVLQARAERALAERLPFLADGLLKR